MRTEKGELLRFRFLTEVRFGIGIRKKLDAYISEIGAEKVIIIADEKAVKNPPVKEALEVIKGGRETLILSGPKGEPEISELEALRAKVNTFRPSAIIGIGGGSTLDMAKGLSALLPNSKAASEYLGFDKLENPALPCVTIPTLFGAGTEVTSSAVMINRERKTKGGINGRFVFPYMAVIDPEMGLGSPAHIMGATALDAIVHAIEGYVARCATPFSRMFSKQAAIILIPALFRLANNPSSVDALDEVAFASLLAVIGLMHSESGICGAISYPLGVHHGVPHGLSGLMMPAAIKFNANNGCSLYSNIISGTYSPSMAAEKLAKSISELISSFGLPSLGKYGVNTENVGKLAEEVFSFKRVLDMNPIRIESSKVISEIINSAL